MRKFLYLSDSVYPDYDSAIEFIYLKSIRDFGYLPYVMFFSKEIKKTQIFRKHNAIVILIPYFRIKFSVFSKLANYYRFFSCYFSLIRREKFLFVQVRNSYIFEFITIILQSFGKYKKIYQIVHPSIDARVENIKKKSHQLIYLIKRKLLFSLKTFIMNHVDYVITTSDKMTEILKNKYSKPAYLSLPIGVPETENFNPLKIDELKNQLGIGNNKIILYFGNIRKARKIEFIFQLALKFLNDNKHNIKFLILYKRALQEEMEYKKLIDEMNLNHLIIFKEEVPRDEVQYYIRLAYLSLSPIPLTEMYIQSSPTKCIESIVYNCPVLATEIPDQVTVVNNSGGGFICKYNVDSFYEKIIELLEDIDLRNKTAMQGKDYILQNRGYKVLTKKVAEFYGCFCQAL